ncbi:YcaO-like family protein [Methylobrevis pamukkalensis]|uniref:YcaO-like family protein n=1 Tax=Methylobrevis pamukkalensis TaxID=1439726 RepID=A0A1E3H2R4_9HYPH|nr:YcaO-like family protein [Methylobrevis pamukkalensis]ODN70445.1 YcaO-like family protein [Methylobrevis pamukkalensis]
MTTERFSFLLPTGGRRAAEVSAGESVATLLAREGFDVHIHDLTRPEIGIAAVKAIVPGLAHVKPRHGTLQRRAGTDAVMPGTPGRPLLVL